MATIIGTSGNNTLNGGIEDDIIFARGGADTVTGGDGNDVVLFEISPAGSDYFDGGAGDDAVLLDLDLGQFDISPVTATNTNDELILLDTIAGVTLTVTDVEKIGFLDAVGYIVGFGSEIAGIQGALDEAAAGDVVLIQGGTYAGNFTIGSAVAVLGVDSDSTGVSVSAASGNVFSLAGNLGAGNQVVLENIAVTGGGNGISVASSTQLGLLAVSGMDFSGLSGSGIITGSGAPGLDTVIITDTTFTGVGATGAVTANGSGSIVLFGFNGDAAIVDVTITNALTEADAVNVRPDHAISITGYDPATYDVTEPAGTITIADVTIEGTFHKNAISIQGFTSLTGITFDNVSIEGASDWGYLVFIDPIASGGDGTAGVNGYPGNFAGGEATSVIDLSGLTVTNLSTNDVGFDVFVRGTDAADTQTGTDARDVLNADAEGGIDYGGNDVLNGEGGADTLFAGLGSDTLDGGDGIDTAIYSGSVVDYSITDVRDGNGVVTGFTAVSDNNAGDGDDGTDSLTSVEVVQFADAVLDASLGVQMFDGADNLVGTFATIQEAVDAAADGYSIMLKTGTYQEQVVVDGIDNLTIAAFDGADVTILAPTDLVETGRSASDREVHAVITVLNSENVTIDGLEVDGDGRGNTVDEGGGADQANFYGVFFRNSSGGLEDVDVTGVRDPYPGGTTAGGSPTVSGVQRGVGVVADNDTLMDFFMHGGSISDFQKNATAFSYADLDISGVTITGGGAQTIIAQNGIQAAFSTGTIDDVTITGIGYAGSQVVYSGAMLLFGNTDLDITNNTIVGANDEDLGAQVGGIYVLDFGSPLYTNSGGQITGNDISHVDFAIDVSGLVSPATILIEDNTLSDLDTTDPYHDGVGLFASSSSPVAFDTEGSDYTDYLNGGTQGDTFDAFGGDDVLYGAGGDDTLNGGDGTDTAQYDGSRGDFAVTNVTGTNDWVTGFSEVDDEVALGGDEGTDTLSGIEVLQFGDMTLDTTQGVQLFDAGGALLGTFDSIQAAVDASGSVVGAVTILVDDGTYNENVVIDRGDLTLLSVNGRGAVTIGDGTGSALGAIEIDPGANNVTIGGVGQGFTIIGLNGNGASEKGAVYLQGAHDGISILDNEIVANGDAGLMGESGFALTNILIDGNEFSGQTFVGAQPGGEGFGTQFDVGNNVPRQLVVLGNGGSGPWTSNNITFTNNLVSGTAGGISSDTGNPQGNTLVTIDAANSLIADNTFTGFTDRFGVAIRARGPDTDIIDNTLDHTLGGQSRGIEVNFQGVPGTYSGNVVNGAATADVIFGMTPGGDIVNGNAGDDIVFAAGAGDDQLFGGADDDTLVGDDGNDLLDGGTGDDSLTGGLGDDTYRVDSVLDEVVEGVGEGNDTIETNRASYTLGANFENLTFIGAGNFNGVGTGDANIITGGNGADRILGGAGNDTLNGLDGNDRLFGHSGTNTLVGGDGDDYYNIISATDTIVETVGGGDADVVVSATMDIDLSLYDNVELGRLVRDLDLDITGSSRADRLYGNSGDNTVTGGAGRDVMVGGAGADMFVFNSITDTGATNGTADRIGDFDGGLAGIDLIDLHHIDAKSSAPGNNAFVWIGTDVFSGQEGELRYSFANGVATTVQGDVDGDGIADFVITLTGTIDLYDGNFLL